MPRMKLPTPAKRRARMIAYIARTNSPKHDDAVAAKYYRAGYDHARRDANHANQESARQSQRYRFNFTRFQTLQREQAMKDSTTCPCAACERIRADFAVTMRAGGTD